jgi:hypothetical protein
MQKLLLISVLMATVAIPLACAKDRSAKRGLKKTIVAVTIFNVLYLFSVLHIYPRLF